MPDAASSSLLLKPQETMNVLIPALLPVSASTSLSPTNRVLSLSDESEPAACRSAAGSGLSGTPGLSPAA